MKLYAHRQAGDKCETLTFIVSLPHKEIRQIIVNTTLVSMQRFEISSYIVND